MERIPGFGQLTSMFESSSELGEDGVEDGKEVV